MHRSPAALPGAFHPSGRDRPDWLLRRLIAHLVQEFCEWRGRRGDRCIVPRVDRVVEIVGGIIRQPDLTLIVLPDQRLRWHVDRQQWRLDHGGGCELRVAEYDHGTGPHPPAKLFGGTTLIIFGKNREPGPV